MDVDISRWIIDFLLRQTIDDGLMNRILSILPLADDDSLLKKTILLRTIQSEISDGSVSEKVLELLEIIAELDNREGTAISKTMKGAYCAVAVDCTARFLQDEGNNSEGKYYDAVNRIWRGRVPNVEKSETAGLFCSELWERKEEIEAAALDDNVCRDVLKRNTRYEAIKAVRSYLAEAWTCMGPSFLELAAKTMIKPSSSEHEMVKVGGEEKSGERITQDLGADGARSPRRDKDQLGNQPPTSCRNLSAGSDTAARASAQAKEKAATSPNARVEQRDSDERTRRDERRTVILPSTPATSDKEIHKGNLLLRRKHALASGKCRGVKINDTEELHTETLSKKYDLMPSPEINRLQEALKSSSLELQAVVKDPLPSALRLAEMILSDMARKKVDNECSVDNENKRDVNARVPSVGDGGEAVQANEDNSENQQQVPQNTNAPKPSLMERNTTARMYEWDDSIDVLPGGSPSHPSRIQLRSPKGRSVSPLKKYQPSKFTKRRKIKKWSVLEEDTLREGVRKFGKGNWKVILNTYRDRFEERTEVDLKDKWRNLMRY